MKRQITLFFLLLFFSLSLGATDPRTSDNNAGSREVSAEILDREQSKSDRPDWTYYIWISAAFVLVAVIGFTENLIREEKDKVKELKSVNEKQLNNDYNE